MKVWRENRFLCRALDALASYYLAAGLPFEASDSGKRDCLDYAKEVPLIASLLKSRLLKFAFYYV